jgi:hypothetical protein
MKLLGSTASIALLAALALPSPAFAAFHLMEIEQVIGGVNGDTTAQAVQLKMRATFQTSLSGFARLVVWDATGQNPVELSRFPLPKVVNSGACKEILLATAGFEFKSSPPVGAAKRDYILKDPILMKEIPASYLAAGSLTFEDLADPTHPLWRTSWGGTGYTGSATVRTGLNSNDDDGTVAPFVGPLPSTSLRALHFNPACPTASTSTLLQYSLTPGAAVFTNNAISPESFTVTAPPSVPTFPGSSGLVLVVALGALAAGAAVLRRRLA